jgi:hypothetical protein
MKPRHPKLDWIKTVLADIEQHRDDPPNVAPRGQLVATSSEPEPAPVLVPAGSSRAPVRP